MVNAEQVVITIEVRILDRARCNKEKVRSSFFAHRETLNLIKYYNKYFIIYICTIYYSCIVIFHCIFLKYVLYTIIFKILPYIIIENLGKYMYNRQFYGNYRYVMIMKWFLEKPLASLFVILFALISILIFKIL